MSIHLTEAARRRVTEFLAARPDAVGLRLAVKRTGCSGWSYVVDLVDRLGEGDRVFDEGGVRVVVDADALPLVDGTEIDFVRHGLNATFQFRNPNVTGECGCGESFTVA